MSFIYLFGCSGAVDGHDLEGFKNDQGVLFACRVDPPYVGYAPIFLLLFACELVVHLSVLC